MADLAKNHHSFFCLMIDGKKHSIKTYFSHSLNEYGPQLMGQMKKQKKISDTRMAEDFFDCPLSAEDYIRTLKTK